MPRLHVTTESKYIEQHMATHTSTNIQGEILRPVKWLLLHVRNVIHIYDLWYGVYNLDLWKLGGLKSYRHNINVIGGGESKLLLPLSRCWECLLQVWIYESNGACRKTSHLEVNIPPRRITSDFLPFNHVHYLDLF